MDDKLKQAIALGREHYEKREYDKAERYLTEVIAEADGFADIHNMMGVIHHDRGRLEEARESFRKALDLNPRYTEAALNLAVTCNDLGQYDEALVVYKGVVDGDDTPSMDPYARGKIANLHAELAQAYMDVGLPNEAVQEYRNAVRLCPHFADLRVRLASVYRQMGDLSAARYELAEAIRVRPTYIPARIALGVVLLMGGQRRQAVTEWEEALKLEPDNKSAQMYLRMAVNPPIQSELPPAEPE